MNREEVMETGTLSAVVGGVIAAAVATTGWVINYVLTRRSDRHRQKLAASLRYTERQLEGLYGPLEFLVSEGQRTFEYLVETLGRSYVFHEGTTLPENDLLMTKTHLIDGEKIPALRIPKKDLLVSHKWRID
jgi:hypothetical protein